MAGELTLEGLRAIEERVKKGSAACPDRCEECAPQQDADVAALLGLLRTVARVVFAREDLDKSTCEVCGGRGLCVTDCPAGVLGALLEETKR